MLMEPDNILVFISSLLALILFIIAYLAYQREHRRKFLLVTGAFFSYFLMNFFDSTEVFFPSIGDYLELFGSFLNFVVLLLFALAILTRD